MPLFRLRQGGPYIVSGVPVVTDALAGSVTSGIAILLIVAVAAMALALLLLFKARLRLLPLLIALAAAAMTFGAMALVGAGLTMAAIAVLPGPDRPRRRLRDPVPVARPGTGGTRHRPPARPSHKPPRAGAPTIATAALATGTGFLVLLLSPIPMVRGFGPLLVHRHRPRVRRRAHGRISGARAQPSQER